ncbi:MAG: hypothetical protein COV46_02070 [Deltaproteobacteria bacterium CG11_big_fil_rev_8_21_14_0_20_49_13]|nr:MAG: hypothetical protein COV46_02070 [Deltaproteobacteria bacterium CG11_big_fil_rev_8_21_14_0_20_49_13]
MKALILAAGRGDRLGTFTRDRPKAMVHVVGKPLIDHVLNFLDQPEIEEIGIIGGYKYEALRFHIEEKAKSFKKKIKIFYNPDFHEGSVRTVMAALDFLDTDFVLLNADHIYPKKMFRPYQAQMKGITVACDYDRKLVPDDMKVKKDKNGFLKKIQKTLKDFDCGYIGSTFVPKEKAAAYREAAVATYEVYGKNSNVEAIIGHMAANDHKVGIADLSHIGWHEVDSPEDRKVAEEKIWHWRTIVKRYVRYIFGGIGIFMFGALVHKLGIQNILNQLKQVGLWTIPILSLSLIWYLGYTIAWYQFLKPFGAKIKFFELFKAKIIGEAVNAITPLNFVAGDPARAYMLRHKLPMTGVAASVVVDRTLHSISTLIVILIGVASALIELDFLPNNMKYGLPIITSVALIFVGFVFIHQHKGLFIFLAEIAQRLRIKKNFSTGTLQKLEEVDGHIQEFYKRNKKGFFIALFCHIFGRFLGIVEVFLIGYAANRAFSFQVALLLGAAAPIINFTFSFIPGSLGVIESAFSGILYFLKYPPSIGITIQIIKRLRGFIWVAMGLVFLGVHDRKKILQQNP